MRWWRYAVGGALLLWVLGTAYQQAKKRNRELGLAVIFAGLSVFAFATAALVPRPPMTVGWAMALIIVSIVSLAMAIGFVVWRGFRE